jgi:hypothetical protein
MTRTAPDSSPVGGPGSGAPFWGAGFAAGNKNACLAIGSPVGWEILDIGNLVVWGAGGGATTRNVQVR